jgi:hypothetical protein
VCTFGSYLQILTHYANLSKLIKEYTQILMNENNKSSYLKDMLEFIIQIVDVVTIRD